MSKETSLRVRLANLGIGADECATLIHRPVSEVLQWVEGMADPDADARVLLRFLANELDAIRRVEQLRRTYIQSLDGDRHDGVRVPYAGGYAGVTGGRPQ